MTATSSLDDGVDDEIKGYLSLDKPKSFFLYAGAGSGKTRSLVKAIDGLRQTERQRLILFGQRIAVITYTNAACDEIKHRLEFDPIVEVSTIHSFAWGLIQGYNNDIREWLRVNLREEIGELQEKARRGRAGTDAALERERSIASKTRRLGRLDSISRFVYSPTGDNRGRDSLNHSEVIGITSSFLLTKPTLQSILVGRFPVLFIDESQDTNKHLMDAFLAVQAAHADSFCLGLFGDVMQRIYTDGKVHLERAIPSTWGVPVKKLNHRCPHRVIRLINQVRQGVDGQEQVPGDKNIEGFVRFFIAPLTVASQAETESVVLTKMVQVTKEPAWAEPSNPPKTLILEHHMAARRLGFSDMYEPLAKSSRLKTGLADGTLPALRFFAFDIYPVIAASRQSDAFGVAAALRKNSPLLSPESLLGAGDDHRVQLKKVKGVVDDLMALWTVGPPTFQQILHFVSDTKLFQVPESLSAFVAAAQAEAVPATPPVSQNSDSVEEGAEEELSQELISLKDFLGTPFDQIAAYAAYVTGKTRFDTHQGVKGLEFPRVMVVISDEEARGFSFSYAKLFGEKAKSKSDVENEAAGVETSIDRTRRLFYVICSRAMHSLAIVAYSTEPASLKAHVLRQQWFTEDEVEMLS